MAKIIVNTQAELDAIPKDFDGVIEIHGGTFRNPIVISGYNNASAVLCDSSSAELWDSSRAVLRDSSSAVLRGSSSAVLRGSSRAVLCDSSRAVLCDSSSAVLCDSSNAVLCDYSQITKISRTAKAELHDNARCIEPTADIDTFCTFHSIQRNEEKSIWYKAVHKRGEKYIADYNRKTTYTVGKTKTVKNLDTDRDEPCGDGIHIAPLHWALEFGKDWDDLAILEVEAVTNDIILPHESDGKVRVGKIKVLREVPLEECGALGKMIAKRNAKESEGL